MNIVISWVEYVHWHRCDYMLVSTGMEGRNVRNGQSFDELFLAHLLHGLLRFHLC